MATLSIVVQDGEIEVLAKTEPSAPPSSLAALLGVELPRFVQEGEGPLATGAALNRWMLGGLSDEGRQNLVQACTDLVVGTNAHPSSGVVLMGDVELVVFASPAGADPRDLEEFLRAMNLPGAEVRVVNEHVARAAAVLPDVSSCPRFLVCEWSDDLIVRSFDVHGTLFHLSPVGNELRSARLGESELARQMAACADTEERRAMRDEALGRLVRKGRNFLDRVLATVDTARTTCALVTGDFTRHEAVLETLSGALEHAKLPVVPSKASVGEGLHRCFRPTAKLPYDCGILLARQGAPGLMGTLVLVRPTAVGQSRTSEQIEIPLSEGENLEVGIYLRRLELGAGPTTIRSEQFERLPFVPEVKEGVARLEVSMRVDDDEDNPGEVVVSIVVRDRNRQNELRFDDVRLVGAMPLEDPLVRDPGVLSALRWVPALEGALRANRGKSFPVRAWREYLQDQGQGGDGGKLSRSDYAERVVAAAGTRSGRLTEGEFVRRADPEEIQAEARNLLFGVMLAFVQELGTGGRWAARYRKPVASAELASSFLNEQAQALASHARRAELMEQVERLAKFYRFACVQGSELNVDWS